MPSIWNYLQAPACNRIDCRWAFLTKTSAQHFASILKLLRSHNGSPAPDCAVIAMRVPWCPPPLLFNPPNLCGALINMISPAVKKTETETRAVRPRRRTLASSSPTLLEQTRRLVARRIKFLHWKQQIHQAGASYKGRHQANLQLLIPPYLMEAGGRTAGRMTNKKGGRLKNSGNQIDSDDGQDGAPVISIEAPLK